MMYVQVIVLLNLGMVLGLFAGEIDFPGTVKLPNGVEVSMVKIKAGSFVMGSPQSEARQYDDENQHRVTLTRDYWLGKYEVTQGQWEAVMGDNPSFFKGDDCQQGILWYILLGHSGSLKFKYANHPVEQVSWEDAKEFCDKLNRLYRGKLPKGYRFDLPTEAQWEYACRAGTTTALNNGKNLTDERYNCKNLDEIAWYDYKGRERSTHVVGEKRPNAWGLYDMHGNVWEWCRDWYACYSGDAIDPTGPVRGERGRVRRGGSWLNLARNCRSAYRIGDSPLRRGNQIGFRLALVPIQ